MSDYISREDVLALEDDFELTLPDDEIFFTYIPVAAVEKLPAADVRPVVMCKDCRHRDPEDHKCDSGETERQGCPFKVEDDYFCAYGER